MSQENVEVVRGLYRLGDPSRFFDRFDEEIELDFSANPLPDFPTYTHGKDAAIDFYRHYWVMWDEYVLELREATAINSDRVLVVQHERARGKGSGVPFERVWAVIYTLRAGKMVRLAFFSDPSEALEAAGLRE